MRRRRSSRSRSSSAARAPTSCSPTPTSRRRRRRRRARCSTTPGRTAARAAASSSSAACYDRFLELLEPAVQAFRVGRPRDEATEMGPLVSAAHRDSVQSLPRRIDAQVAFRGTRARRARVLVRADRAAAASRTDRVATEEIFGPVVSVLPFDDEADAIALANASVYGLSGSIWTRRPRPRHPRRPRRRERQPLGQLALVGALHDPVRRHQAVRPRPRARTGRGRSPSPRPRTSSSPSTEQGMIAQIDLTQRLAGRVAVITGGASGIGLATAQALRRRGRDGRHRRRRRRRPARRRPPRSTACSCRSTSPTRTRSTPSSTPRQRPTAPSTSPSTTPASRRPTTTRSRPPSSTAWDRVQRRQPHERLPLLARGAAPHGAGRARARSSTPRRSSRCWARRPPDLVHRVEGRRARDDPRARRAVRAPGHPRQRALPRAR